MGALYQVNPPSDEPTTLLQASAGDIELHGVWVALSQKGKHLTKINLSIDWRCLKNNLPDYSMTIWAIDKKGALIFEEKRLICYGLRPTSSWKAGERVIENYRLILPDNMPPQFEIRSGVCLLQDEKLKPFHPSEKIDRNGLAVIGIFEPSIS